jgi:hypothetical protein
MYLFFCNFSKLSLFWHSLLRQKPLSNINKIIEIYECDDSESIFSVIKVTNKCSFHCLCTCRLHIHHCFLNNMLYNISPDIYIGILYITFQSITHKICEIGSIIVPMILKEYEILPTISFGRYDVSDLAQYQLFQSDYRH